MLNLQTIVEDLGLECGGKAWVIVTSQEAIDLITNSSNLKAFMALRKVIEEENLTPDETKTIIKKAIEDLNNGILQAEQPKIINNGEDR